MIKKLFFKFLPLISVGSIIAVPLASCATTTNKNDNLNKEPINGLENTTAMGGVGNSFVKGKLATEIEKVFNTKKVINTIDVSKDNSDDVYKSISEVLTNDIMSDKWLKKLNKDNLSEDIYSYLYWLYVLNRSYFSFYLNGTPTFEVDETQNVTLNISLKIANENGNTEKFNVNEKQYEIKPNEFLFLNISINKIKPSLTINKYNNRYFLGLQFSAVSLEVTGDIPAIKIAKQADNNGNQTNNSNSNNNDNSTNNGNNNEVDNNGNILKDFSFTSRTYSNVFLTEYSHVTSTLDYNSAIKNSQVIDNYNKLTNETIGKEVSEQINVVQSYIQRIIALAGTIIDSVSKDETVTQFIDSSASSIVDLLFEAKILPDNNAMIDLIKKLLNTKESILDIIGNNRELLVSVITQFIGNDFFVENLIRAFVEKIKPSMTNEEKTELKKQFQDLIRTLGVKNVDFLNNIIDSLFNGATIIQLLQTVLKDQTIIDMITKAVGEKYKGIVGLVRKVFTEENKNKTLLEIIVNDKDSITTILSSLINDATLSGILNVMITNNTNFSYQNVKKIFTTVLKPIANQFLNNTTKEGKQTKVEYSKETKKLTYSYKYIYTFNKDLTVDLTPLKGILPDVIDLQKMGINTNEIEGMVANNKSNINKYIILNTNNGKEWYKFKKEDITKQLPDSVTITTNDKLVFDYNIQNQDLWLNPTKIDGDKWVFGYQIPYVADIYLDAPGMFKSISDNLQNKTLNNSGAKIWDSIASKYVQMLAKVYNFTGILYISQKDNILNDFDYSNRLYMKDYSFQFNEEKITKENFDKAVANFKNTTRSSYQQTATKITSYKTEVSDQNMMNELLIKDYSNLNLVKHNYVFTYSQMTTIKSEKDSSGQDVNALQFWLPLNVRQGLLWYSDNVLDLYINININNFTSTSFLPFKILDKNNNWVDSFTTSAFSVDITASSVIKFLSIIKFPVSFPIINLYQN